ncbi:phospholipid phosphatase 2-like isoform X2 [Plodia interpunctella]|uniref:phospholipid phosphatase 2-like isoform X2 n=1 Tax=Plodia interpunctella TaxID=58824 RepID=UPI002367AB5E|nr:phospholipid phosphatase 2-like isoform X2 [Plodia interpunctella]
MVQQHNTIRTSIEGLKRMASVSIRSNRPDLESQQLKPDSSRHSYWWTLAVDLPLFALVLAFIGLFELNIIPSHKAGFFCRDPSLDHVFTGDTVSMKALCLTILFLPIPVLWMTEWIFSDENTISLKSREASIRCLRLLRVYMYGFLFNISIVEALKGIAGSPRPTFNAICKPDVWDTCKDSEYVTTFKCTSSDFSAWFKNDASHSFPSGHTSLSVYCAFFLSWYLQKRAFCWSHRTVFLVPFLQLTFLSLAALASLTRVTDHRHHWWDVLFGLGIGLVTTYYAVVVICNNFTHSSESNELGSENNRLPVKTLLFDGRRGDTTP